MLQPKGPDEQFFLRWRSDLDIKLGRIESILSRLSEVRVDQEWVTVAEFAKCIRRAKYTVREWCRTGRLNATKTAGGRGGRPEYRLSRAELLRYEAEGLLGGVDASK